MFRTKIMGLSKDLQTWFFGSLAGLKGLTKYFYSNKDLQEIFLSPYDDPVYVILLDV